MGRTLIREIAQGSGITLCGALEMEGHPNLGMDSGTLAGHAAQRHQADRRSAAACWPMPRR